MLPSIPRRTFLQASTAWGFVSSTAFGVQSISNADSFAFIQEKDGTIFQRENAFPFEKTPFLPREFLYENILLNRAESFFISVESSAETETRFLLFWEFENSQPVYKIVRVVVSTQDHTQKIEDVVIIDCKMLGDDGYHLVSAQDHLLGIFSSDDRCFLYFREEKTDRIKCLIWDENLRCFVVAGLKITNDMTFSILPSELFDSKFPCFVLMDESTYSHRFLEIREDADGSFCSRTLCEISHGQSLSAEWTFQYSTMDPYYNYWNPRDVDRYAFVLNSEKGKPSCFVCERGDGKLIAFRFVQQCDFWSPEVIAITENSYPPEKFHFFGKYFDNVQKQDVILAQNRGENSLLALQLDGQKWIESPVDFGSHCSDFQSLCHQYFQGIETANTSVTLIASDQNSSMKAPLSFVTGLVEENELRSYPFGLSKNDEGYHIVSFEEHFTKSKPLQHQKEFPAFSQFQITPKKVKDDVEDFFSKHWEKFVDVGAVFVFFKFVQWCYLKARYSDIKLDHTPNSESSHSSDASFLPFRPYGPMNFPVNFRLTEEAMGNVMDHFFHTKIQDTYQFVLKLKQSLLRQRILQTLVFFHFDNIVGADKLSAALAEDLLCTEKREPFFRNYKLGFCHTENNAVHFNHIRVSTGRGFVSRFVYNQNLLLGAPYYQSGKLEPISTPLHNHLENMRTHYDRAKATPFNCEFIAAHIFTRVIELIITEILKKLKGLGFYTDIKSQFLLWQQNHMEMMKEDLSQLIGVINVVFGFCDAPLLLDSDMYLPLALDHFEFRVPEFF